MIHLIGLVYDSVNFWNDYPTDTQRHFDVEKRRNPIVVSTLV